MVGSFYKRGDYAWVQDVRANFLCIYNGNLVATVFSTEWQPWQVIFHYQKDPVLLTGEHFADPFAAMSRAEGILSGAAEKGFRVVLPPFWKPA